MIRRAITNIILLWFNATPVNSLKLRVINTPVPGQVSAQLTRLQSHICSAASQLTNSGYVRFDEGDSASSSPSCVPQRHNECGNTDWQQDYYGSGGPSGADDEAVGACRSCSAVDEEPESARGANRSVCIPVEVSDASRTRLCYTQVELSGVQRAAAPSAQDDDRSHALQSDSGPSSSRNAPQVELIDQEDQPPLLTFRRANLHLLQLTMQNFRDRLAQSTAGATSSNDDNSSPSRVHTAPAEVELQTSSEIAARFQQLQRQRARRQRRLSLDGQDAVARPNSGIDEGAVLTGVQYFEDVEEKFGEQNFLVLSEMRGNILVYGP